jgi:membrane glycosyltransferase
MSLKMRQNLDEFEQAYVAEVYADRRRQDAAIKRTEQRQRTRHAQKTKRHGTIRFMLLVLAMIATAVIVTIVMFRTLYMVMG